ncbi:hypothetical protein GGQ85_003778 [Nitrobacter vulgaris]|nr:hypothetical protein [Nitrobacter vulgaris]
MRVVRQPLLKGRGMPGGLRRGRIYRQRLLPGADAQILNERAIGYTAPTSSQVVAYCLAPSKK